MSQNERRPGSRLGERLLGASGRVRPLLLGVAVLGLFGALVMLAQWTLVASVVNAVFLEHATLEEVLRPLAFVAGAILLRSAVTAARETMAQRGAIRIKTELRDAVIGSLFRLGSSFASRERSGELVTTALEGPERMEGYYARFLAQAVLTGLVPPIVLAYAFWLDPLSGLVLALTGPLIPLFMWLIGLLAQARSNAQWLELRRMSAHLLDVLQGLGTLKLFNRSDFQRERIATISEHHREATMGVLRVAFLSGFVLELTATISTALVAVTVGLRLLEGKIGFETALLVLLLAPEFDAPFRQLGLEHHAGMEGHTAATRVFEVLDEVVPEGPCGVGRGAEPLVLRGEPPVLEYRDLGITYPGESIPALEHVSFRLEPGAVTALIGPSGAGKTTLARLTLRLIEPSIGSILVNGRPIDAFEPDRWRQLVAYVSQEAYLFAGSVVENLRLARPEAGLEDIWLALELAGAAGFVRRLPQGLETIIGERGARLSGGERQRLAMARAFLKDAPVLVLDEATSHLDLDGDQQISEALIRLARNRTTLLIAHRQSTILRADRAVRLEGGCVVAQGTPQAVLASIGTPVREEVLA